MPTPIRGKVAKILNTQEIVINVGSENEVALGMRFIVMNPDAPEIEDPDTGELLGSVERPKALIKIVEVQDRLAVASPYSALEAATEEQWAESMASLSEALMPTKWWVKRQSFNVEDQTWEGLNPQDRFVKVGDPVVQVV